MPKTSTAKTSSTKTSAIKKKPVAKVSSKTALTKSELKTTVGGKFLKGKKKAKNSSSCEC